MPSPSHRSCLHPRVLLLLSLGLWPAGCLVGGQAASAPSQRDSRLLAELQKQERWAGEAAAGRASRDELKAARSGDVDAQADLRQRFRKLLRGAERATWVREATFAALEGLADDEQAQRVASFDKAARLRKDAWDAADEIAQTLCAVEGPAALSLADLRRGLSTVRAAQKAEQRIAKLGPVAPAAKAAAKPGDAPAAQAGDATAAKAGDATAPKAGTAVDAAPAAGGTAQAKTSASPAPAGGGARQLRLAPAAPPVPKPFIEAAALLLEKHPAEEDGLRAFKPDLAEEATLIRTALADLRARPRPEADAAAEDEGAAVGAAAGAAADAAGRAGAGAAGGAALEAAAAAKPQTGGPGQDGEGPAARGRAAAGDERSIEIKGEARAMLRRRGPPRFIVVRPDGSFVLRYDPAARCAAPPCPPAPAFHFGPEGARLFDAPAPAPAGAQPAAPGGTR